MNLAVVLGIYVAQSVANDKVQKPIYVEEQSIPAIPTFSPDFDDLVDHTMKHFHIPGVSIAIFSGNDTRAKVSMTSSCLCSCTAILEPQSFNPTI